MKIIDLGLISYSRAEEIQLDRLWEIKNGAENTVFFLRHPPVITLGKNGGRENLLVDMPRLKDEGIEVVQSSRGGNITCHFPDQLIMYPVLRIEKRSGGIKKFFSDLQEAAIRTLDHFGISAHSRDGYPGVWTNGKKIASIGIAVKHWITYHGLSLNIGPDLSLFEYITPCGLREARQTSIHHEINTNDIEYNEVKEVLSDFMQKQFTDSALDEGKAAR